MWARGLSRNQQTPEVQRRRTEVGIVFHCLDTSQKGNTLDETTNECRAESTRDGSRHRLLAAAVCSARQHDGHWYARQGVGGAGVQKAPVLTVCGPQLSHASVIRRHALAHVVL